MSIQVMNYEYTTTHDFRNNDREICAVRSSLDMALRI